MAEDILFSIIIPTRNPVNAFFDECIESIKKQTINNYEIIVVANDCNDCSLLFIKHIIEKTDNAKLFITKEKGVSRARNKGIAEAKGNYIIFLDDDDVISPFFLELSSKILKEHTELIIFRDCNRVEKLDYIRKDMYGIFNLKRECFLSSFFPFTDRDRQFETRSIWGKVFKKSIIEKFFLRFNENIDIGEDVIFSSSYALKINNISTCDFTGIYYRHNDISVLNKKDISIVTKVEIFLKEYKSFLFKNDIDMSVYYNYAFNHSLLNIFQSYFFHSSNSESFIAKRKRLKCLLCDDTFSETIENIKKEQIINRNKKIVYFLWKIRLYTLLTIVLSMRYRR